MVYNLLLNCFSKLPGINLFKYVTFRTFCAIFTSFLISVFFAPYMIKKLKKFQQLGQPIRSDGPETHFKKVGTPTMGGLLISAATFISTMLWADVCNKYVIAVTLLGVFFSIIGFIDDYKKVKLNTCDGISPRQKMLLQIIGALTFSMFIETIRTPDLYGILTFPFFKNFVINLGVALPIFTTFVIVGSSNAVNLTDGLDGLVTVPIVLCAACFGLVSYLVGHVVFANYLQLHHIQNAGELCILCGALLGAGLGFLWYNAHPASVFMGDAGSLYVGAVIGGISVVVKQEFLLAIVGGVFVVEALSVMIQVLFFRKTGKRIFLMAPIHHHFEKKGWFETTVVVRFWIISTLLALIALSTLKIR